MKPILVGLCRPGGDRAPTGPIKLSPSPLTVRGLDTNIHNPSIGPQTGVLLLSSREVEAAARGPDGQFRPELAIGGPSWPRDRAQSKSKHGWKLGASLTAPGDHSEPISDNSTFPDLGLVHYLTYWPHCHFIFCFF